MGMNTVWSKPMRRLSSQILICLLLFGVALPLFAQDSGGQLWVQSFEDRNGNGQRDAGEPFLTRGVSVDLLNASGVVMASGTLDGAPYANQGFVGFLYLDSGTYTVAIISPDLRANTPDRVEVTITAGAAPITVLYGAQRVASVESLATSESSSLLNSELARVAFSGFAALIVIGVMAFLGVVIYTLVLRRRYQTEMKRYTTGSMRAARADETGEAARTETYARARTYETVEEEDEEV